MRVNDPLFFEAIGYTDGIFLSKFAVLLYNKDKGNIPTYREENIMKLEKLLAALIACTCALTAATVSAFATSDNDNESDAGTSADGSVADSTDDPDDSDLVDDETPAYVYTWQVPASENPDSGWVAENITQAQLIGTLKPADVDAIVIKGASADDEIGAGFNTTLTGTKADGYYQTNDDDENWPSNSITIKGSAIDWENYYLQLFSNRGEATTVTVSVYTSADDNNDNSDNKDDNSDSTPSDSDSGSSDSASDSNSGGLIEDSSNTTNGSGSTNPGTGVAMTFIPAIIAGAAVIAAKKRK